VVTARAPGKVILFGEHAVIYGEPALVVAIDKYVHVSVEPRDDGKVRINARDLQLANLSVTFLEDGDLVVSTDYGMVVSALSYVKRAIELTLSYLNERRGANVSITSDMPVGAGLGTSAAVSVSTVAAFSRALGHELSKDEIANLAWRVERDVQGSASPTDTRVATHGGVLFVKYSGDTVYVDRLEGINDVPIVVGYTPRIRTTREMVDLVRRRRETMGDIVDHIIRSIGAIARRGRDALLRGDLVILGELMNINHGLLDALGVSTKQLNDMVYAARRAGALGSKLTGAGGGGCMIAISDAPEVEKSIEIVGGLAFRTRINSGGLTLTTN